MIRHRIWRVRPGGKDMMVTSNVLSVRDAADALQIDRLRLFRLARYMGLAPGDKCIPLGVVSRAAAMADSEERYQVLLAWFLKKGERTPDD